MKDGDFLCEACKTKLNASDLNCWRCGSRNLTDMRPSRIGAGPFNVPINHQGLGGPGAGIAPVNVGPFVPTRDGVLLPPAMRDPNAKTGGVTLPGQSIGSTVNDLIKLADAAKAKCGVHRWLLPADGIVSSDLRCFTCGIGPNLLTDYFDRSSHLPAIEPGIFYFYRGRQWK